MNTEFALWPEIVKNESEFISYFVNNSLWQMRSVSFINTIIPFRNTYFDIFINCNWVDTRWQLYSTHLRGLEL